MNHRTSPRFWKLYGQLSLDIRDLADKNFELLEQNPRHPSLHFKKIGPFWSVRVGIGFRAVGLDKGDLILWVWIGPHVEYKRLIAKR